MPRHTVFQTFDEVSVDEALNTNVIPPALINDFTPEEGLVPRIMIDPHREYIENHRRSMEERAAEAGVRTRRIPNHQLTQGQIEQAQHQRRMLEHAQNAFNRGRAENDRNRSIWEEINTDDNMLQGMWIDEEGTTHRGNPSIRVAGKAPAAPITSYIIMKKLIGYVRNRDTAHNNDTHRLLIKVVTSVAIKRYGNGYTDDTNIQKSRERVCSWVKKNTGIEFVRDDLNTWALIHPEAVFILNSERGMLQVSRLTYEDHMATCQHTGQEWLNTDLIRVSDRGAISPTAYDELGYWYCDNCRGHRPFHEENCGHCSVRGSDVEVGKLYGYNDNVRDFIPTLFDTPAREFVVGGKIMKARRGRKAEGANRSKPKSKLYYGLELEVIPRDGITQKDALYWTSSVMKNYSLMKADSSLAAGGFEIVTAPATLEFHRKKLWHDFFNLKLPSGKTASQMVKSWNTTCCGLHIHFTRAACSEVQLSKLMVFYHSRLNSRFLSDLAGRMVGAKAAYCHQKEKTLRATKDKRTNKIVSTTVDDCMEHHDAITISKRNGGKTVEVRIFRGNATMHGLMRALDLVAATTEWCLVAGINKEKEDLRYTKFLEWFDESSNRSRFPDLWKHLISLGYLGTRHKSKNKKVLDDLPSELKAA